MNSNLILKSDILDIIFEKRNKAYGAYILRKFYEDRLKKALAIMILTAGAFLSFALIPQKSNHLVGRVYDIPKTELAKADETKPKELPKKPEVPKKELRQNPTPVSQVKSVAAIKIVDDKVKTDTVRTIKENDVIGGTTVMTNVPGTPLVPPVPAAPGTMMTEPVKVDKTTPMGIREVDVPPAFPGGTEALLNFLRKHLNNPEPMTDGESVSVKVTFVVGYEGKLQSFKITEDGGDVFNKEVIRVLKKMPDWVPGKAKGENVSVYYTIPVKFTGTD